MQLFRTTAALIEGQLHTLRASLAKDSIHRATGYLNRALFGDVADKVSSHALHLLHEQRKNMLRVLGDPTNNGNLPLCHCRYQRTMGLPCLHRIKVLSDAQQQLPIEEVHWFWHRSPEETSDYRPILEPPTTVIGEVRGRPRMEPRTQSQWEETPGALVPTRPVVALSASAIIPGPLAVDTPLPVVLPGPARAGRPPPRPVTCSICGQQGHTRRTCRAII